jgi:imidazolonepropionase-like amidohydrolase
VKKLLIALACIAVVAVVAGLLLARALRPPPPLALPAQGAAFSDVTVIEPDASRREHRFVSVEGDRIASIESARPDPDDPFAGAFLLPGLNDLHVHFPPSSIPGQTELWSFLFLLHGVTGVRDAGDVDGTASGPAIEGIRGDLFPGPRILACGPFVDGDPPRWSNSLVVTTPEEGRRAVQRIVGDDFDCVKAYDGLDEASLDAIREEAHSEGLPLIGHVPRRVPFEKALLDDAQHLIGVRQPLPDERPFPFNQVHWADVEAERIDFVIATSLENDLAHTPTLVTTERLVAMRHYAELLHEADALLLPRFYRDVIWSPDGGVSPAGSMQAKDFDDLERALEKKLWAVKRMYDAGVRLHSGTDTLVGFVVPGSSLHRELRMFERAGLTPEQALAISTGDSAESMGVPQLGLLRPGAPAELALFREDPTRSLDALDSLVAVVRDGRLYSREDLEAQLARYRRHYDGALFDAVMTPLVRRAVASTMDRD